MRQPCSGPIFGFRLLLVCLLGLASLMFWACQEDVPNDAPPAETAPVIRRLAPTDPSSLVRPGQIVDFRCLINDNQQLAFWRVERLRLERFRYIDTVLTTAAGPRDTVIARADTIARETLVQQGVDGLSREMTYNFTVPDWPVFTRIELWAYVEDIAGQTDSTMLALTIDFAREDTLAEFFSILSYTRDTLWAAYADTTGPDSLGVDTLHSAYNLIARQHPRAENTAAQDVADFSVAVDSAGNPVSFMPLLRSPNNGLDSVFVVLPPSVFNYDLLTYATMRQAWETHLQRPRATGFAVGDVVIVRLRLRHRNYRNYHHFAALRIVAIRDADGTGNDALYFDYKRSQDRE